jgi:hypothetical protein
MYLSRILLSIVVYAVMTVSCATLQQSPDWIAQPDINYPNNKYLVASASAESLEIAQDRAITNIAKIFSVSVNAQVNISDNIQVKKTSASKVDQGKLNEQVTQNQSLSSLSSTKVNQVISGVSIKQQWQDSTGVYYALAVLEKSSAATALAVQIQQINQQVANLMIAHNTTEDAIARLKILSKAFLLLTSRNKLLQQLAIVSHNKKLIKNRWTFAQLQQLQRLDRAKVRVKITSATPDNSQTLIISSLSASLRSAGFSLQEPYNYVLLVDFTRYKSRYDNGWYWQSARLNLQLDSLPGHISQSTISWDFKASSSKSLPLAEQRLLKQVNKKINSALVKQIINK